MISSPPIPSQTCRRRRKEIQPQQSHQIQKPRLWNRRLKPLSRAPKRRIRSNPKKTKAFASAMYARVMMKVGLELTERPIFTKRYW
mmetsp:Transcript_361/g.614  ORF Transcript_361/g.614 Transcript_361/m.614 type:complete len:86 (+) Transcript_361:1857-2114(+)